VRSPRLSRRTGLPAPNFLVCCKCGHKTRKFACPECRHVLCTSCRGPERRRRPKEQSAEDKFCDLVDADGGEARKMNGLGYMSWPDRLVLRPGVERALWVEFKREGEDLTPSQKDMHKKLKRLGQRVVTCWTLEQASDAYATHQDYAGRV
jgi:hypothetical protein